MTEKPRIHVHVTGPRKGGKTVVSTLLLQRLNLFGFNARYEAQTSKERRSLAHHQTYMMGVAKDLKDQIEIVISEGPETHSVRALAALKDLASAYGANLSDSELKEDFLYQEAQAALRAAASESFTKEKAVHYGPLDYRTQAIKKRTREMYTLLEGIEAGDRSNEMMDAVSRLLKQIQQSQTQEGV